jgi:hypothetical protein
LSVTDHLCNGVEPIRSIDIVKGPLVERVKVLYTVHDSGRKSMNVRNGLRGSGVEEFAARSVEGDRDCTAQGVKGESRVCDVSTDERWTSIVDSSRSPFFPGILRELEDTIKCCRVPPIPGLLWIIVDPVSKGDIKASAIGAEASQDSGFP